MKTNSIKSEKRKYKPPYINKIRLDNEISLALESQPVGPDESSNIQQEYYKNDPFKNTIV